jgi:IS605 OrfB family transposase
VVRLSAKVKLLLADEAQSKTLDKLLRTSNKACNWLSEKAWESRTFGQYSLHKLAYAGARELFSLPSQVAIRCIAKVADAYKLDKQTKRAFRPLGSLAFDDRNLTWHIDKKTVSLGTLAGRIKIEFAAGERQMRLLASRQGESDLVFHNGNWFLTATCNVETPDPADAGDFLGVDFGVANIASDSDGKHYSGSAIKSVRHRHRRLRTRLQKKQTKSARRRLRKLSGKEARFARDVNHCISKQIVATAKGTGRGIALEDLSGIRDRVKVRHTQRVVLHSWAFLQLGMFCEYKAILEGVQLEKTDPRNSSRECNRCGHVSKSNRPNQYTFRCVSCSHRNHADTNAAANHRGRALRQRAERLQPAFSGQDKLSAFSR